MERADRAAARVDPASSGNDTLSLIGVGRLVTCPVAASHFPAHRSMALDPLRA